MRSSVCLLLLLALENNGLLGKKISRRAIPNCQAPGVLYDEHWLLAYEGAVKGWLPEAIPTVQADPYFGQLYQRNIHFLDLNIIPSPIFKFKNEVDDPSVVFDSDGDIYDFFDFRSSDEDYLGRRSSRYGEVGDEDDDQL